MMSTFSFCAYCWQDESSWDELLHFKCDGCSKKVHFGCIKSNSPSPLLDDSFFHFKCEGCAEDGKEDFTRMKMSWKDVVALSLYHLQKTNQGRCGYFHWRGHICAFIDANWQRLFGQHRKKTTLWLGTIAGVLSGGCPDVFTSGADVVEMGYWRLTQLKPPLPHVKKQKTTSSRRKPPAAEPVIDLYPEERRCRRSKDNALAAAMELKEKRAMTVTKGKNKPKLNSGPETQKPSTSTSRTKTEKGKGSKMEMEAKPNPGDAHSITGVPSTSEKPCDPGSASLSDAEDADSVISSSLTQEPSLSSSLISHSQEDSASSGLDFLNAIKVEAEDEADDLDIDIGSMTGLDAADLRPESPDLNSALRCVSDGPDPSVAGCGKSPVAQRREISAEVKMESPPLTLTSYTENMDKPEAGDEAASSESDSEDDDDGSYSSSDENSERNREQNVTDGSGPKRKIGRPRKRRRSDDAPPPSPPTRLKRISVFEERELLQQLNESSKLQSLKPDLAQLRRKLICNQTNREFGLPVFDLDGQLERLAKSQSSENVDPFQSGMIFPKLPTKTSQAKETRDLDRFMMQDRETSSKSRTYTSFQQRLVGLEDHELKPVVSPYTTRILLPFIWRNYNPIRKPLKLRLLQEIKAYAHRNDPSWQAEPSPPIDFCYVRPEHIPSVNALCREFFWPGIDMSECLQYPDFSCVVLYRKIVIAFSFMVPDRGYNEAYISFIFTHPEWRGAGIATFMLYHLTQTCMGKDVLLHVSATNTAMLLYQKFGFKAQEFILNFYYKYFPFDSNDSTHAVLMRLTR